MNLKEQLEQLMGGWDDYKGCKGNFMQYGIVCSHDKDCFCNHRQEFLAEIIVQYLEQNYE